MKILIIAVTNFDLYSSSSVVYLLKKKDKSLEFKLLLRDVLGKYITPEIRNLYSEINLFKAPALTPPLSKNPLKTIFNFFDNFYQCLKFKGYIKKILLGVDIVIVCFGPFRDFFVNMMFRNINPNIRLIALRQATQLHEEKSSYIRRPILSFILNIKNFLFGYTTLDYKWRVDSKYKLVTKSFVKYPYQRTISITDHNFSREGNNYRLPPPFVVLRHLYNTEQEPPAILVAGEKTPYYNGWNINDQKKYGEFLDYLRENFKNYILYFKPKAKETDPSKFNLKGFQILPADIPFEEICLKKNIKKIISIGSNTAKISAYFGIPSYIIYPLFGLPKELKEMIVNLFDDMDSIIRVNKFEDLMIEPNLFIREYSVETLASLYWEAIIKYENKIS